jgi:hypothetical protein
MRTFKLVPTLALSLFFGLSAAMAVQAAEGNRSLLTKDVKIKPSRPDSKPGKGDGIVTCQAIGCTKPRPLPGRPRPVKEDGKVVCTAIGCPKL